ncbi:glycerophosphoryl diester phosphodiesterase [Hydrogenispora ethanolica]|uniref:Glycerophosphoryl diester phosphodiesterase n=1 Tax=Hydrogenispora ethanolica TaxID=1082276 RepID=A0A4R1QMB2_HYDET|nr:glycerophosphodiester phosphodiesterase family protein [Hydrogenispora ethanolica]TCL54859.1 glycerophosphoryl diester phosphodiesterase [Hydrogenispora ethanolica]
MALYSRFEIIGHRGAKGYAPENTVPSFLKALELGATMVEFDLRFTADREIVVIHDETVNRTTDGQGRVSDFSYQELRRLDAGAWFAEEYSGARIPLFEEVLDLIHGRAAALVEIKAAPDWTEQNIALAVEKIFEHDMAEQVEIISFDHSIVRNFKKVAPQLKTGILYIGAPVEPWLDALIARAEVIHPCPAGGIQVQSHEIARAHAHQVLVGATTQSETEMARLITGGVDGICSDYPDLIREAWKRLTLDHG